MSKLRFVIDTNVFISAAISPHGKPNQVVFEAIRRGILLASMETFEELTTRLQRPKFLKYITLEKRDAFIQFIRDKSQFIAITEKITACTDPDDDMFLEVAMNGQADYIITGNIKDFPPSPFRGLPILRPAEFLEIELSE